MPFKLSEFCRDSSKGFSFQFMTPYDWDSERPHNLLNIKFWRWSWWIKTPKFIDPQFKFKDLSHREWATVNADGTCGYTEDIQRSYGFSFTTDSLHVHYGIQPGCWMSKDPKNSDHVKVWFYPWLGQQTQSSAFTVDGKYLCNLDHFRAWEHTKNSKKFNKETKNEDFEHVVPFNPPIDNDVKNWQGTRKDGSTNFSDKEIDPKLIYKFYDFMDYDGTMTRAKVNIEERVWCRGQWKWLQFIFSLFNGRNIVRSIDIEFRNEIGREKGSYKGGTMGMGFNMLPNESLDKCWDRFIVHMKNKGGRD